MPTPNHPPEPILSEHRGKRCYMTRWRQSEKTHTKRWFVGSKRKAIAEFRSWFRQWLVDHSRDQHQKGLTVHEVAQRFLDHAWLTYQKNDEPTSYVWKIELAMQLLVGLHGRRMANAFTPQHLAEFLDKSLKNKDGSNRSRITVNQILAVAKQAWQWGAHNGFVESKVANRLTTVLGLEKGKSGVVETAEVRPIEWEQVEAILAEVPPYISAMIQVQWHTGMRPEEVCSMRGCDIDRGRNPWQYQAESLESNQTDSTVRVVPIGPKAKAILRPFLTGQPNAFIFDPRQAPSARKTGITNRYTARTYRTSIQRACDRVGIQRWTPSQLRLARVAQVEREFGIEAAREVLGRQTSVTTKRHIEPDFRLACRVAMKTG